MKLVSYNIQYGKGRDGRYDLERIAGELTGADIIALQEVERFWQRSGMLDQPAELARLLEHYHWVYGANLDMHCDHYDAAGRPLNRRRQFGTMVLSRWPILSSRNFPLPKYGTLSQHSIQQGLLETVIDTPLGAVRCYSVHLSHLCSETRLPQVEFILTRHREAYGEGGAWCGGHPDQSQGWTEGVEPPMPRTAILMGDLNCNQHSPEYARLIGPLTPKHGRLNHRDGFVDAWVAAGHDENSGATHPDNGTRIDHCFVTPDLAARVIACRVDDQALGSDHWPLWVELEE
jgi:endonuclease/exonuclease/phosphatase family metal-dependent hydrolase